MEVIRVFQALPCSKWSVLGLRRPSFRVCSAEDLDRRGQDVEARNQVVIERERAKCGTSSRDGSSKPGESKSKSFMYSEARTGTRRR